MLWSFRIFQNNLLYFIRAPAICHPTVTQIVFNETPPQTYVEYFLELSESIGMYFETF